MSLILLRTSYENGTPYGDRTSQFYGTTYDTTSWYFDTDSLAVLTQVAGIYDNFQDASDLDEFKFDGEFYAYCAGTTRRGYVHDGYGSFTVEEEENSLSCGFVPPAALTCDLASASVSQTPTPGGATLEAKITGTVNGRLRYRLDAGTEQASRFYYNVLPGAHVLSLRDDGLAGCERTVRFVVAPPPPPPVPLGAPVGLDFVGQPVWYRTAPVAANADVALELWAESAHGAEDFSLVFTLRKRADKLGAIQFRLDTLLWPLLSPFVPTVATATTRCRTNLVNYYVRTSVLAPGRPPVYATGPLRTAVRGSLPAEWRDTDYFRFRTQAFALPPFLSWQPAGPGAYAGDALKRVTLDQPEWLFWLCPVDVAGLRISRSYDQGPHSAVVPVVEVEPLAPVPARGWQHQLLAIPLRAQAGYQRMAVRVESADGQVLSPPAWYTLVEATPQTRYVLFTNSLSGVDTLRCEGRLEGTLEVTAEKVERPAAYGDAGAAPDRQVSDVTGLRKLKLASGWLSPAELAWVQELLLTREAWQQRGPQLLPLDVAKRSLAPYSDEKGLRGLLLEFDYAFAPTAYAPTRYA
ncbi:hypothetical protein GO988_11395 [Hymenobacter sp. HMF4947]|uniref:Uncharacterized protein n=1 Tax=Hymenobacter ginkgonis TaxID=2682976 RepID=A0A7K1TEU2_9BACT|nr:hypothetical protein [Hymenobacter ginkgonis]MVN76929.1 hypothetical protein [Hymenobacter ginkgonis]